MHLKPLEQLLLSSVFKVREDRGRKLQGFSRQRSGRVLSEEFLVVLPFIDCWSIGYWAAWDERHPKLRTSSADAINLGRIQPRHPSATVAISEAHGMMQVSRQMSHVTMSCHFHRKLLKISEILHK